MSHPFFAFQQTSELFNAAMLLTNNVYDENGHVREPKLRKVKGIKVASIEEAERIVSERLVKSLPPESVFSYYEKDEMVTLSDGREVPHIALLVFEVNKATNRVAYVSRRGRANSLMMSPNVLGRLKWASGTLGHHVFPDTEIGPTSHGWTPRGTFYGKGTDNPVVCYTREDFPDDRIVAAFKIDKFDAPAAIIDGKDGLQLCLNDGHTLKTEHFFSIVKL